MSLSKLESLPNEILLQLFEEYINGVDIINTFNHQLNQRFDRLIAQCHRLRFNFIHCPMDNFRICMGLLPAYINRVEELAISDEDTPGQVHAFLSFFPYLIRFTRLRKLYIYVASKSVDWIRMQRAVASLAGPSFKSLSIEAEGEMLHEDVRAMIIFCHYLANTVRKVCLLVKSPDFSWEYGLTTPSSVQYLIAPNIRCEKQVLYSLLKWAPRLKYLHISISNLTPPQSNTNSTFAAKYRSPPQSELRTLILTCMDDSTTMDDLAPYFSMMPLLNRLDMTISKRLLDAHAWEMLLTTSLPVLRHFILRTTESVLNQTGMKNVQASFQNTFWISKTNFHLIVTIDLDHHPINWKNCFSNRHRHHPQRSLVPYLIIPDRSVDENTITVDENVTTLSSRYINTLPNYYYFNNVKDLYVSDFKQSTLNWIMSHANYSQISELALNPASKYTEELGALLVSTRNKRSLYIDFQTLLASKEALMNEENCLKRLDISASEHSFKEDDIRTISHLFPQLEHLLINTADLQNVPLLKTYLPYLNSLTYNMTHDDCLNTYCFSDEQYYPTKFRQMTNFFCCYKGDRMTIWLDHRVYEKSYWKKFDSKSREQTIATSIPSNTSTSRNRTTMQKIFSFLKISKK